MPRRPDSSHPNGHDRPRQPADPQATAQSLKGAREALERLRRYLDGVRPASTPR